MPPAYTAMRNLATYEGVVRECIHALKYENNQGLGEFFVGWLAKIVLEEGWLIDVVIPVPLSSNRMRERGYNQSALIARPMAARLGVRHNPFGLHRIRDTHSQVGLSGEERHQNVLGAFEAVPAIVDGMKVLLIDDVMTTGATMSACANSLNLAGAKAVYCLTIARFAVHNHGKSIESHQV
jgi:ComF family protein